MTRPDWFQDFLENHYAHLLQRVACIDGKLKVLIPLIIAILISILSLILVIALGS